jgi:Zn-dependent metalloprotease
VDGDYLVWSVRVAGRAAEPDVSYLIDAHTGKPRWMMSNRQQSWPITRRIYDATNGEEHVLLDQYLPAYNFTFGRSEGQPARGIDPISQSADVDLAYDQIGTMRDYLADTFGRWGANGYGGTTDEYTSDLTPGWANLNVSYFGGFPGGAAYLQPPGDGRITYSKGWVEPSITGHEYCHAIQYFTHPPYGMSYVTQSGALMESHADVFGEEFRKYLNGSTSWIFDIPGMPGEVIDLSNPNQVGISTLTDGPYPDSMYARTYYCGDLSFDSGGVHVNARPLTKAAWLATVGGVYNNCTITALGMEKVAAIWYRAIFNYYSSAAQFNEAYLSLQQACSDLYPSGDCAQVLAALQAVEFDQPGRCDTSTARRKAGCAPTACYDSDGADNGNVAGYVTYYTKTYIDFCANSKVVLENYCSTDVRRYKYVACTNGCLDGRCLP